MRNGGDGDARRTSRHDPLAARSTADPSISVVAERRIVPYAFDHDGLALLGEVTDGNAERVPYASDELVARRSDAPQNLPHVPRGHAHPARELLEADLFLLKQSAYGFGKRCVRLSEWHGDRVWRGPPTALLWRPCETKRRTGTVG